jgi:hypothetical protein
MATNGQYFDENKYYFGGSTSAADDRAGKFSLREGTAGAEEEDPDTATDSEEQLTILIVGRSG